MIQIFLLKKIFSPQGCGHPHWARAGAGAADLQQPDGQGEAGGAGAALQVPGHHQGDHAGRGGARILHRVRHQPPGQGGPQHAQLQVSHQHHLTTTISHICHIIFNVPYLNFNFYNIFGSQIYPLAV